MTASRQYSTATAILYENYGQLKQSFFHSFDVSGCGNKDI